MNLNIKDLVTLEDNIEYLVCSIAHYEGFDYTYLIDINNNENIKICKIINKNGLAYLEEIQDDAIITKIVPILYNYITEEVLS